MKEKDLGLKLSEAREEKGFSREKVCDDLKIQVRYIEALEEENFGIIPGEVYVKAFIKTYADYLGLDGRELVDEYKARNKTITTIAPEIFIHHQKIRDKRKKLPVSFEITPEMKVGALVVLAVIFLVAIIFALKSCVSSVSMSKAAARLETSTMPPLLLEAEVVSDDCWFEIIKDNEAPVKGMYPKGYTHGWSANEAFYLKVGNRNNMKFTFNGKLVPLETFKEENNVVSFTLKREETKKNAK